MDNRRIADQKLVVNELESLRKLLEKPLPPSTHKPSPPANPPPEKSRPEKGYNYSIKEGDTLSAIVAALRTTGIKITSKQVMDANPGVNWNRLKVNQVIFIPSPTP